MNDLFSQPQTSQGFKEFVNRKLPNPDTIYGRLYELLKRRPVTCEDCSLIGCAGSALPKRISDLKVKFDMKIEIHDKEIISKFSKKKVKISEYRLIS